MKLHLTLLTFILISINSVFSQNNNLQFNRAIMGQLTGLPNTVSFGTIVVPVGKVWKLESTSLSNISGTYPSIFNQGNMAAFIGNMIAFSNEANNNLKLPIWLPSGSYSISVNVNNYAGSIHSFNYSGIEFNLVP